MSFIPSDVVTTSILFAAFVYLVFHVIYMFGLSRGARSPGTGTGRISVLVVAHNEERTIGRLLTALEAQTIQPYEIIVVDDRSNDDTASLVRQYAADHPHVKILSVEEVPEQKAPKKYGIERGVEAATGDIILCTDADCVPPKIWVERMRMAFEEGTGAVIGTYIPHSPRQDGWGAQLLHRFIRYERLRLALHGLGSAGAGFPWLASGASFGYRKETFLRIDGFWGLHRSLSGDDDLLVQRIWQRTDLTIRIVPDRAVAVETSVPESFGEFLHQRRRHGGASRYYLPVVKVHLALYHASNLLSLAALPIAIVTGSPWMFVAYGTRVLADVLFLAVGNVHLRRSVDWPWIIPLEFLYGLYTLTIAPLGYVSRRVGWGGTSA